MQREDAVAVTVVGDGGTTDEVIDVLGAETAVDVAVAEDGVEGLDATALDTSVLVVAGDPTLYESIRDVAERAPVVVVAEGDAVDRTFLDRVVSDPVADHVDPSGSLTSVLPVRIESLADSRASAAAWRLADFADEAVVEFDLETTRLVDANEAFFDAWGWDDETFTDATLTDLRETDITAEFRGSGRGEEGEEDLEWISHDGSVESLFDNALGSLCEIREWHCHDDEGRGFKSNVRIVADGASNHGYLVATVPDDLDANCPADRDEASMLQSLLDHIPMSVYFKDTLSRHVVVSEDVVEPFIESPEGKIMHTPEDVVGKTDFDLYPAAGAEEGIAEDREVMESGKPVVDSIEHVQPPHGRPLFFQTTKAPWYADDGRVQGLVGITVDITDQKRREMELDRQNERLDQFAGIVSHDLRNPLNVAKGRLDMYRRNGEAGELDEVEAMHERMERLIEDVLTFARDGSRVEEIEWFNGADLAETAWKSVDTAEASLRQEWDYRIGGDPNRLVRLFENLFRNAVEHGSTSPPSETREDAVEHGGEDVTVRVGTIESGSGFFVEDDGPGIPEDERDDVFEHGVTSNEDGTGYGLAIVREIADAHGWNHAVTVSDEGGARFEFTAVPRGSEPE